MPVIVFSWEAQQTSVLIESTKYPPIRVLSAESIAVFKLLFHDKPTTKHYVDLEWLSEINKQLDVHYITNMIGSMYHHNENEQKLIQWKQLITKHPMNVGSVGN